MTRDGAHDLLLRPLDGDDPAELAVALAVLRAARSDAVARGTMPPSVHPESDWPRWFADQVVPAREVWVAEVEGAVVGLLVLDTAFLDQLHVAPAHQGHGVGAALLGLATARRPDGFDLWVFEQNAPAIALYERHGLVLEEQTAGEGNQERAADRRYRWPGRGSGGGGASVGPRVHARLA